MNDAAKACGKPDRGDSIRRALMKLPIAISLSDRDGRILSVNDRFIETFGYTPDDIHTIEEWWPHAYPDPVNRQNAMDTWAAATAQSIADGTDIPALTYGITCKDGTVRQVEVSGVILEEGLIATFIDVTERKHAEDVQRQLMRELRAISDCNQALMRAEDEQALLDEVTRIIVEEAGYRVAFVAYAEQDAEQTVRPVAWAGMNEDYFAGAKLTWADRDLGQGPIGTAIRTGSIVEIPDIATDPRMLPWRQRALERGYRSGVAFPLKDDQRKVIGGLLIYSGEANAISGEEIRLLDELAGDLAFGITSLRARAAHRQAEVQLAASEQLFRALVENSPDPIARYDRELRRIYINPAIRKLFKEPVEQVLGKPLAGASPLVAPDSYMAAIRRVIETAAEQTLEGAARTPDGEVRWSSWRFTPEFDCGGKVATVLVISHDITDRKRAEDERQAYLGFLENLDRVNRAIQGTANLECMMGDVLNTVLEIFGCDRAYLQYPCDPDVAEFRIPMERCSLAYPSAIKPGQTLAMNGHIADTMRTLLKTDHPIQQGPGTDRSIPEEMVNTLGLRSMMAMALRPRSDRPWQFGIHQCSQARTWNEQEVRLFEEIGRRISDALNNLLATRSLRESEQLFRALVENSPDFIARYDRDLRRVYVNPALQSIFSTTPNETLGQPPTSKSPLVDPEDYMANLRRAIDKASECSGELAYRDLDGELHWGTMRAVPEFDANGSVASVLAITRDITDRVRNEDQLRLAASVFSTSQEGILISDADNRIIDVNPAFTRLTGYTREEVIGLDSTFLSATPQDENMLATIRLELDSKGEWQGELWNQRKSGEAFAELLSVVAVKDEQGHLQHYVSVFSDISVLKAHEADLDRIAHYDTLTGVPNRRLLSDRLEQAIARARRHGSSMAVCYLDLDGFKPINDQFGHEGGDRLLMEVARRLQSLSRADDTVARLGGDEFVLIWNDIGAEAHCTHALDRVLAEVSAPIVLDGIPVAVSASIGVTLYPEDNVDADSLLRHADHAMYSAKQLGKNRYQMFDSRLEQQITSRVEFLAKVGHGLDRGQFELYYQPKFDYAVGRVVGVEALVRWNEPILGVLSPKEFLPLIEEDNLAFRLGRWVMEEAIRQARRWHESGLDLSISINIFPRHLKYPTFIEDLRNAIATHWPAMPRDRLMLEIVETSELEELDPIEDVIKQCLKMGIASSLDDFGTGYSSLIYLRRLSVEELKIDQSFVRDMLDDPEDNAIVVGVIGLGKAFGLRVVAEGVESQRHARRLIELGCTVVQGYGVGMPMPVAEFEQWLAGFASQGDRLCK